MKNQLFILLCLIGGVACAQTNTDKQTIRQLVDRANAGERLKTTDETIFWSGAYPRPRIGKMSEADGKAMTADVAKRRANQKQHMAIERLTVAKSGDVADEYGTFTISYDSVPDKKPVAFDGAYLRTWRKEKGGWLVDVVFIRPFDDRSIATQTK